MQYSLGGRPCAGFPLLLLLAPADGAQAQEQNADRKPMLGFTIANAARPALTEGGPLFGRVKAAFAEANRGDGTGFARFLAPQAELTLTSFSGAAARKTSFTVQTIRAATQACLGPYVFDEAKDWVELSWVCRTDAASSLAPMLTFDDSAELSLTVWFDGGRIKKIQAMEPLHIPGQPRVRKDAYAMMQGKQR